MSGYIESFRLAWRENGVKTEYAVECSPIGAGSDCQADAACECPCHEPDAWDADELGPYPHTVSAARKWHEKMWRERMGEEEVRELRESVAAA